MSVNWITGLVNYSENVFARLAVNGVKYAAVAVGALLVALILTPLCREMARRFGMVDQPDERRINKVPIPRGGGLSIFVAFHLVLGILALVLKGSVAPEFSVFWQKRFLLASGLLVAVGLVDDKCGLKPFVKLFGQIGVALVLYCSGVHIGGIIVAFPPWLDCLATVFWITGAVNAFNLIDGLDGLATGLALIASIGLAGALLFTGHSAATLPYLALAGACLGFLRYNFYPASVFLGDTGSMFLGLCVATLPLVTGSRKELVTSLGMPLLAMGIPIFDTMLAIWRRSVRALLPQKAGGPRTRVMLPDKEHVHHRLLRVTMNQRTAAIILYVISAVLVIVGLGGTLLRQRAPGLFLIAFITAILVVVRHLERAELWDTGRLLSGKRETIRQGLLVPLYILLDVLSLNMMWVIARWAAFMPLDRQAFLSNLPMYVAPVFVALVLTKTYWRVWSRAQIRDFLALFIAVSVGTVIGTGLVYLFYGYKPNLDRFTLIWWLLAVFAVASIRLWREALLGSMQIMERHLLSEKAGVLRFLAYGGGVHFRSYLRERIARQSKQERVIVGIVDDDIHLKGRIISGYRVIGGEDVLPGMAEQLHVDGIIITCVMTPEKQQTFVRKMAAANVRVSIWMCEEYMLSEPLHRRDGCADGVIGES